MGLWIIRSVWILLLFGFEVKYGQGLECGYPGAPAFGRPHPVKESYRAGDAVAFTCVYGYTLQGPLQRVCLTNGTWAPPHMPLCDRSVSSGEMQASSRQTLSLYPPENAIDGNVRSCSYTDKRSPRWIRVDMRRTHRIRAVAITVPPETYTRDPAHFTIYAISVTDSTTATYHKCATFSGLFASSTLQLSCAGGEVEGRYVHVKDERHRVDYFSLCEIHVYVNNGNYECGEVERPAHAYAVRTESGSVSYKCVYGHRLEGAAERRCLPDGQWSLAQPLCREILCPRLTEVPNGRLQYTGGRADRPTLGTTANVTCDYGYHMSGVPFSCGETGRWIGGNLSCQPVDCGVPSPRHSAEEYVLLNVTQYGGVALLRCGDREVSLLCREDGTWSRTDLDCQDPDGLATLGLIEEEQSDVTTGIAIGMAVVVFLLLFAVFFTLFVKRRKVIRQNSADTLPSKETTSSSAPPPEASTDTSFYSATLSAVEAKRRLFSTILFPRRKISSVSKRSDDTTRGDSGNSSSSSGCIYEEVGVRQREKTDAPPGGGSSPEVPEAVYARVDLEEKRRSRMVKSQFESVDPPPWGGGGERACGYENCGTYRPEEAYDEVDLEPIKLRELPPIPDDITYASLSLPLDPPTLCRTNDRYEGESSGGVGDIMKDNELYLSNDALKAVIPLQKKPRPHEGRTH